ncbi:hypothetical protein B0H19DRAFT_1083942 [Mycena capillaripes]|nr:hypothetical protein B0H19DRAFT_1083942 [Mycena capillaripes]
MWQTTWSEDRIRRIESRWARNWGKERIYVGVRGGSRYQLPYSSQWVGDVASLLGGRGRHNEGEIAGGERVVDRRGGGGGRSRFGTIRPRRTIRRTEKAKGANNDEEDEDMGDLLGTDRCEVTWIQHGIPLGASWISSRIGQLNTSPHPAAPSTRGSHDPYLPLSSPAPQHSGSKSLKTLSTTVIFNQDQLEAHYQGSIHQDSILNNLRQKVEYIQSGVSSMEEVLSRYVANVTRMCGFRATLGSVLDQLCNREPWTLAAHLPRHRRKASGMICVRDHPISISGNGHRPDASPSLRTSCPYRGGSPHRKIGYFWTLSNVQRRSVLHRLQRRAKDGRNLNMEVNL